MMLSRSILLQNWRDLDPIHTQDAISQAMNLFSIDFVEQDVIASSHNNESDLEKKLPR
jgi:hypothetical protein